MTIQYVSGGGFSAEQNNLVRATTGSYVISGLAVSQRGAGANMSVDVATGSAVISATGVGSNSTTNVVISAADPTNPRYDLIYINSSNSISVTTGTPATTPIPPALTSTQVALARIYVAAAVTSIVTANIFDERLTVDLYPKPFVTTVFGGDGSDGALNVTSGTTTVTPNTSGLLQYSSINVSAGATLTFDSSSHNAIYILCQGNCTIAGTVLGTGLGGGYNPGTGQQGSTVNALGTTGGSGMVTLILQAVSDGTNAGGGCSGVLFNKFNPGSSGGGAGSGGSVQGNFLGFLGLNLFTSGMSGGGKTGGSPGTGGSGGASIYLEVLGNFNFTGAITSNGTNGTLVAGGGGGGVIYVRAKSIIANSGTITTTAGSGSSGGGNGGAGFSLVERAIF